MTLREIDIYESVEETIDEFAHEWEPLEEEEVHHSVTDEISEESLLRLLETGMLESWHGDSEVRMVEHSCYLSPEPYQSLQVSMNSDYRESLQMRVWEVLRFWWRLFRLCESLPSSVEM